jgi:hypothetical protein
MQDAATQGTASGGRQPLVRLNSDAGEDPPHDAFALLDEQVERVEDEDGEEVGEDALITLGEPLPSARPNFRRSFSSVCPAMKQF